MTQQKEKCTEKRTLKQKIQKLIRKFLFFVDDVHFYLSDPFSINCFEQTRRQLERMSEEDREYLRQRIENLKNMEEQSR